MEQDGIPPRAPRGGAGHHEPPRRHPRRLPSQQRAAGENRAAGKPGGEHSPLRSPDAALTENGPLRGNRRRRRECLARYRHAHDLPAERFPGGPGRRRRHRGRSGRSGADSRRSVRAGRRECLESAPGFTSQLLRFLGPDPSRQASSDTEQVVLGRQR